MKLLKDAKADQLAALLKGQPEINLSALLKSPLPIQVTWLYQDIFKGTG